MRARPAQHPRLFPLLLAVGGVELLAEGRSPFMPPSSAAPEAAAAAAATATLEYRGNLDLGDGLQFRLFDPAKKSGVWVRLNQRNEEFDATARRYDDEQKRVVYDKVRLVQEFRNFDFLSPWEGAGYVPLPGDEKAGGS